MSDLKFKYLLKVEPGENNNKYYKLQENSDGTFTATYGRVGAPKPQSKVYPIREWDSILREKLSDRKGYKDQTDLFAEVKTTVANVSNIIADDTLVANLIIALQGYALANTAKTYLVKADSVTRAQVDKAQKHIDALVSISKSKFTIEEINKELLELFRTIPRKMEQVGDHLVYDEDGYFDAKTKKFVGNGKKKTTKQIQEKLEQIINDEQSNLDTMASQVISQQPIAQDDNAPKPKSLIESLGLQIKYVTDKKVLDMVKDKAQEHGKRVRSVFEFVNVATQKAFDEYKAHGDKIETLWHGSRKQNWWWIVQQGLKIRPSNAVHTGSMFDDGVYFASEADKSMGYTDSGRWVRGNGGDRVYMALYNVRVGKQLIINRHDSSCYSISKRVKAEKYDSVWAKKGPSLMRDEFIVYNSAQSTIKYLVEFSA